MTTSIHFLRPELLGGILLLIPLVAGLWYLSLFVRRRTRLAYAEEALLARFSRPLSFGREFVLMSLWLAVLCLMLVAAAGPVIPDLPAKVRTGTVQVIAVVDVSASMAAEEYRPVLPDGDGAGSSSSSSSSSSGGTLPGSRLEMVRSAIALRVLPTLQNNEFGVVTYTGKGFSLVELTDDYRAAAWVMRHWLKVGSAPGGGSDISAGLREALAMFARSTAAEKEKVIVLFSDGGFNGQQYELDEAIKEMRASNVRLVVIGTGSDSGATIPVYDDSGLLKGYRKNEAGEIITTAINEPGLRRLAMQADGQYIRLNQGEKLEIHWADALGSSRVEFAEANVYQYPLAVAAVLCLLLLLRGLLRQDELTPCPPPPAPPPPAPPAPPGL